MSNIGTLSINSLTCTLTGFTNAYIENSTINFQFSSLLNLRYPIKTQPFQFQLLNSAGVLKE